MDAFSDGLAVLGNLFSATQAYWAGMSRYATDFREEEEAMTKHRLVVAEDHAIMREGLCSMLESTGLYEIVGQTVWRQSSWPTKNFQI